MGSSLVITVNSARSQADNGLRHVKSSSLPREEMIALSHYFKRLSEGLENANIVVQSAALAPVRASGTNTLTFASIANNDTVTIAGTALTCVTAAPSGAQFRKITDGPTTAANLAAAINANAALSKLVFATAVASVVTITCLAAGTIGNLITQATSNGTGFVLSAATLTSGAGGAETAPVAYSRGL